MNVEPVQIGYEFEFVRTSDEDDLRYTLRNAGLLGRVSIGRDESVTDELNGDEFYDCECSCGDCCCCCYGCDCSCDDYSDDGGWEVVNKGPLPYNQSIRFLNKFLKWMRDTKQTTDSTCGLHVNISFVRRLANLEMDPVKLVQLYQERRVAEQFGRVERRCYANMWDRRVDFTMNAEKDWEAMCQSYGLTEKYMSVSFSSFYSYQSWHHGGSDKEARIILADPRLEFRSPGGIDYQNKFKVLRKSIGHMVSCMRQALPAKLEMAA